MMSIFLPTKNQGHVMYAHFMFKILLSTKIIPHLLTHRTNYSHNRKLSKMDYSL